MCLCDPTRDAAQNCRNHPSGIEDYWVGGTAVQLAQDIRLATWEGLFMTRYFIKISICVLSVLCSLHMAQAQQCTASPAGIAAWFTGEGTANDFLGSNNGTLQNGAAFAPGKVGQAFSLNGANQFVSLPANFLSYPATGAATQPISVDAWFQTVTGGVILGQ